MRQFQTALVLTLAVFATLACADHPDSQPLRAEPKQPLAAGAAGTARIEVRAPIVRVAVRIAESFPPQYFADITSALRDGCAQYARADLRRAGDTVIVDVFNTRPSGDEIACTMLYGESLAQAFFGNFYFG